MTEPRPLWLPSPERAARARINDFLRWLRAERGLAFDDYESLWRWSVDDLEGFWGAVWHYFDIPATVPYTRVLEGRAMPGTRWFPGARLNVVDQVFRHATADRPAIVAGGEHGRLDEVSWAGLRRQVAALAATLRALGVQPGDRVVAILPNVPATIVAFLAAASVGATWSVCASDMGPVAVLDRFRQIEPVVLVAADGYRYGGKAYDRGDVLADIRVQLPTLRHTILVPVLAGDVDRARFPDVLAWAEATAGEAPWAPLPLPSEHPLWVLYSSGTTGVPKAIVHSHAGALVEMLKGLALHRDVRAGDRLHWYTSTGWVMWNVQASALFVGATAVLYDGHPGVPDFGVLWRFVERAGVTFFGAGAAYYANCMKAGIEPRRVASLQRLHTLGSTGSPLPPEAYRWVHAHVSEEVWPLSIAGGTDLAGAFLTGLPTLPVHEGEMQCRALGLKVEAWDERGRARLEEVGELVCTEPFPSMPLYFWNDPDGARYRESYFEMWPGVWRHGDWLRLVRRAGAVGGIIYGRSDATINRHGVRMGTAELYRAVEAIPEVVDSLVVDLEYLGRPSWMALFVVPRDGVALDDALERRLKDAIRTALSPRHVPDAVVAIPEVPRTLSGKKMELPIKKLLLGHPADRVAHADAMANPRSLDWFVRYAAQRAGDDRPVAS